MDPTKHTTPTDFSFPGTPYAVQQQLMTAMYETMDTGRIGLFESPTGTGKTLSLICSTLTWLTHNRVPVTEPAPTSLPTTDDDYPSWVIEQTADRQASRADQYLQNRHLAYKARVRNVSSRSSTTLHQLTDAKRARSRFSRHRTDDDSLDALFEGLDEPEGASQSARAFNARRPDSDTPRTVRIIFATRTHSQLAQFVQELRKTRFCPLSLAEASGRLKADGRPVLPTGVQMAMQTPLSIVLFGSRKQSCVNKDVLKLSSSTAISERCRELTERTEATGGKRRRNRASCIFHDEDAEQALSERILIGAHDIEDVAEMGRRMGACPYFAMRAVMAGGEAEVIGAPYSAVVHAGTRESVGITIDRDTVVVFDEGHNVNAAVRDLHSCVISADGLHTTIRALKDYMQKYDARFSAGNLFKLRQVVRVAEGMAAVLAQGGDRVLSGADLVFEAGVDNVNLFDLVAYMKEARLSKKLRGFVEGEGCSDGACNVSAEERLMRERRSKQSIASFERLIECICECGNFGRVAVYPVKTADGDGRVKATERSGRLKYFVVEAGQLFASSFAKARSILLVGGTLTPRQALKDGLLGHMDRGEIVEFECDHVVPAENVMARVCAKGPCGVELEFTYRNRKSFVMIDELGRAVEQCVRRVNGGVIIFFSSYDLMGAVWQRWTHTKQSEKLNAVKPIVVELRNANAENDSFKEYQNHVRADFKKAGILLAVMGGKLSEGINFCDALGRMVIVVGLPFGNAHDLEMAQVLNNLKGANERNEYMENECMTVVNQCIGRAVRHATDFATIVLLDQRFARPRVMAKLPAFIKRDLRVAKSFNGLEVDVSNFFNRHQ